MIPRLLPFSVLVSYVFEVTSGSTYEQLQPIDVVRTSTVGNISYDCFEDQYDMPLVFWHKANLESKLALIRSLDEQDVSIKRELLIAGCKWLWNSVPGLILLEVYSGDQQIKSFKKRGNLYSSILTKVNSTHWRCDDNSFVEHVEVNFENEITVIVEANLSAVTIDQCEKSEEPKNAFNGTNRCHHTTYCTYRPGDRPFAAGNYWCVCRPGYYSALSKFDGALVEMASPEEINNKYSCHKCWEGCDVCDGPESCMAKFMWTQSTFLGITVVCIISTVILIWFVHKNRRIKVFRIASPTFLIITLIGCIIMYSEMGIMFPECTQKLCVATKWTRHFGFCITYSALLMKTWRVSLTYRVKSAHKLKLTDKQLLQWMTPILVIILVYMGAWTLSDPPQAVLEKETETNLRFWRCSNDWWDYCLAAGEVLFLAWGVRVCYVVRNAESFYNEAQSINFAIYNIFIVNIIMMTIHFFLFPDIGPNFKYTLGFIRTQLSTSVTIALVFGSKVVRVLNGQGDHWDNKHQAKGLVSYEMNDICEETSDLQTENEELKEEIFKLATQIGLLKNSLMHVNNRHLRKNGCQSCNPITSNQQSPTSKTGSFFKSLGSNSCLAPSTSS
ncbi:probable G-protein coupled receptor CG31760 isoform X2 [Rhopalosiphum padi]|uniref:probable G-protein coupled receptor CG31760 isoform X2 n=1 Tax=Rhopalosiphum padi TaxID=40932 RepID=UPI00298EA6F9|nr:probable G-protein coupled receptor CG31760 isoform X2 [Rhopalosiphum padi]